MKQLKDYKKEARKLFFLSIDKDINNWKRNYNSDMTSEFYTSNTTTYSQFCLNFKHNILYIRSNDKIDIVISKYKIKFLILDYKIFFYIIKLKHHFKQEEKNNKIKSDMKDFDAVLSRISDNYKSEIRKEKLIKLDN